jgi:hypothetical protein
MSYGWLVDVGREGVGWENITRAGLAGTVELRQVKSYLGMPKLLEVNALVLLSFCVELRVDYCQYVVTTTRHACCMRWGDQEGKRFQAIFIDGMHLYDYTLVVRG